MLEGTGRGQGGLHRGEGAGSELQGACVARAASRSVGPGQQGMSPHLPQAQGLVLRRLQNCLLNELTLGRSISSSGTRKGNPQGLWLSKGCE